MKNILVNSILALAMLSLVGCYESANSVDSTVKTTKAMKCGAGKCGASMKKGAVCDKGVKCGAGKCGDSQKMKKCGAAKKDMPMKCGTGKCGSTK